MFSVFPFIEESLAYHAFAEKETRNATATYPALNAGGRSNRNFLFSGLVRKKEVTLHDQTVDDIQRHMDDQAQSDKTGFGDDCEEPIQGNCGVSV
jgi:hypothetical protein